MQKIGQKINKRLLTMNELYADVIKGIKEEQFFLVYQPLFHLDKENIAEAEALIRWRHPEKGLLYPDKFIAAAEQTGAITVIDQWVLEMVCKQHKHWKTNNIQPILISVNISVKTFELNSFLTYLVEMVNRYEVDPAFLQLEITERMVINNVEDSISKLNRLRAIGVHVAIDDFGIGYSSLSYIAKLPVDSIKIDKSFTGSINAGKEAKVIISSIINLCKALNLTVIAEGIEDIKELEYLKLNRCDIGQGYYFMKPAYIDEIEEKYLSAEKSNNHGYDMAWLC